MRAAARTPKLVGNLGDSGECLSINQTGIQLFTCWHQRSESEEMLTVANNQATWLLHPFPRPSLKMAWRSPYSRSLWTFGPPASSSWCWDSKRVLSWLVDSVPEINPGLPSHPTSTPPTTALALPFPNGESQNEHRCYNLILDYYTEAALLNMNKLNPTIIAWIWSFSTCYDILCTCWVRRYFEAQSNRWAWVEDGISVRHTVLPSLKCVCLYISFISIQGYLVLYWEVPYMLLPSLLLFGILQALPGQHGLRRGCWVSSLRHDSVLAGRELRNWDFRRTGDEVTVWVLINLMTWANSLDFKFSFRFFLFKKKSFSVFWGLTK